MSPNCKRQWQHFGKGQPVNFVTINFPAYQGMTMLHRVLHDADIGRNSSLDQHLHGFRGSMRGAKRRINIGQNKTVQAVADTLEEFFRGVSRAGIPYQCHFAVCTALESLLDWRHNFFSGKFVTVENEGPQYGDWKHEIRGNSARFVQHLQGRGIRCEPIPAADTWFEQHFPVLENGYSNFCQASRDLLPTLFQKVAAVHGEQLVWLDVQGLSEDKVALKLVKKALPTLDVVRLTPTRTASTSEICYF